MCTRALQTRSLILARSFLRVRFPKRCIATTATIAAVHTPHSIPSAFRNLDKSLLALGRDADVYVDTSQLRLVRKGLESPDAVTRVAVLGVGSRDGAARLARALLADPLSPEPEWERQLLQGEESDSRALLLKYNEKADIDNQNPLVKTIYAPSSILHANQLEILVHSLDTTTQGPRAARSLIVPSLDFRNSFRGSTSSIKFPVHKSLIYVENLDQLSQSNFNASDLNSGPEIALTCTAIDGSWSGLESHQDRKNRTNPVNLSLGEVAIESFRKSLENASKFEHAWFDSGLPSIASWLLEGTGAHSNVLKESVWNLGNLVSQNAVRNIREDERAKQRQVEAASIPSSTRDILDDGISSWAEDAHTELQQRLDGAFLSKSWNKARWWKLLWRVDEIEHIATDLVLRAWLIDSEKEMIWVSGRISQSGLLGRPKKRPKPSKPAVKEEDIGVFGSSRAPKLSELVETARPFDPETEESLIIQPWSQEIQFARSVLARNTIPPLQALAQKLLLQSVSTTALTSALSALLYVSVSATSIFEAGAIAAIGLTYSLRRLQRRWEDARGVWQTTVRENGRDVLRRSEATMRDIVRDGGRMSEDSAGVEQRETAKRAVQRVETDLDELRPNR